MSDRKGGTVRVQAEQVVTRKVEAPERNTCPKRCFNAAMQDMALLFPVGKTIYENLAALGYAK